MACDISAFDLLDLGIHRQFLGMLSKSDLAFQF